MEISKHIKKYLKEKGENVTWLAGEARVTRPGLAKMLEAGVFRTDTLALIAKALEVPVAALFSGTLNDGQTSNDVQNSIRVMNQSITDFAQVILWISGLADRYPEEQGSELIQHLQKFQNPMARMLVALGDFSNSQQYPLPVKHDFNEVMEAAVEKNISELQNHRKGAKKS